MRVLCMQSFFGLTQLGPQSNFHACLLDSMDLSLFSEEEFARAFAKLDKDKSGFLDTSEVPNPLFAETAVVSACIPVLQAHTDPVVEI